MVRKASVTERADEFLDYLFTEWEAVPQIAAGWASRTEYEWLEFDVQWPIREDRMGELLRFRAKGQLTRAQEARLGKLLDLVARYRSTVEELVGPTAQAERQSLPG